MEQAELETVKTFEYLATLMKRRESEIDYAHRADWVTPLRHSFDWSVLINERLALAKLSATKDMQSMKYSFFWQDPFGNY